MMESAVIAREFPGFGNPWSLDIRDWNALLDRRIDVLEDEQPAEGMEAVKRHMKRMQRQRLRDEMRARHGAR